MIVQLLLGFSLEVIHGSIRVPILYTSGVLLGSFFATIWYPLVPMYGSAAGIYALIGGQLMIFEDVGVKWSNVCCN